ncbi:MAG: hypothetical protein WBL68_12510 [Nitrososphaeraceae archaeon]
MVIKFGCAKKGGLPYICTPKLDLTHDLPMAYSIYIDDLESLSGSSSHVFNCSICNSHNTELMPIATDESFRIEYSLTRGMELEFYKTNKVVVRQQHANEYEAQRQILG